MRKDLILKVLDRHKDRRVDFSSKNQREQLASEIEAVLQQNTYNTLEELICFVFVAGMGTAEAKHIDQMEGMRRQVADLAIGMRKESIKPEDIVSKEQLEKIINDTKEDEF